MSWFQKLVPSRIRVSASAKGTVPEGLWTKCPSCNAILYREEVVRNLDVCPKCDHHFRLSGRRRLDGFLDAEGRQEIATELKPGDPLKFKDTKRYRDRVGAAQKETGEKDALVVIHGSLRGRAVVAAAFDFTFMGGSMGSVVGEKFVRGTQTCIAQNLPFICFCASGGARMQESLYALFQMAKTSAALTQLAAARLPFISILTDPTMGGVSASLAMLGDIIIAEPNALIGFAGPRVIEQTVREKLPDGFQRSEFLLQHGAVDSIIDRRRLRDAVTGLLDLLMSGANVDAPEVPVTVAAEPRREESSPLLEPEPAVNEPVPLAEAATTEVITVVPAVDLPDAV